MYELQSVPHVISVHLVVYLLLCCLHEFGCPKKENIDGYMIGRVETCEHEF